MAAFEAWAEWDGSEPEPTVEYEIHYEPHDIPISRACTLVWNCTDIVPGSLFDGLVTAGLDPKRRTYTACARVILAEIKSKRQVAGRLILSRRSPSMTAARTLSRRVPLGMSLLPKGYSYDSTVGAAFPLTRGNS